MKNIICIADLCSIHDQKWLLGLAKSYNIFLIQRKEDCSGLFLANNIKYVSVIKDFSLWRIWRTYRGFRILRGVIKEHNIQAIHAIYADPNALWAILSDVLKVKYVITTRGSDVLRFLKGLVQLNSFRAKILLWLYRKAFSSADLITCTSQEQIETINQIYKSNNVKLIRTGLVVKEYKSIDLMEKIIKDDYIFFPRMMKPVYNHEFSISAIENLPTDVLGKYKMVFVDKNGDLDYVQKIDSLMQSGNANYVFLPKLDFKSYCNVLSNAALVVMNPITDGTPVTAFEALYFDIQTIVGPAAMNNDFLNDKVKIFNDWNSIDLTEIMVSCLLNNSKIKSNKKFIEEYFNTDIEMQKLKSEYEKIGI